MYKLSEMTEKQFKKHQLKKITNLFKKIDCEFSKLPPKSRDDILEEHSEYYSLNHCIRWGLNACEELENKKFIKVKEKTFKPIKELNAEIMSIENAQDEDGAVYWVVESGLCESMGERGYIYTLLYDNKPLEETIIKDIKDHIKEQIQDFEKEFVLSATEEEQLEVLKKIK